MVANREKVTIALNVFSTQNCLIVVIASLWKAWTYVHIYDRQASVNGEKKTFNCLRFNWLRIKACALHFNINVDESKLDSFFWNFSKISFIHPTKRTFSKSQWRGGIEFEININIFTLPIRERVRLLATLQFLRFFTQTLPITLVRSFHCRFTGFTYSVLFFFGLLIASLLQKHGSNNDLLCRRD